MHKSKLSRFLLIAPWLGLQGATGLQTERSYLSTNLQTFQPANLLIIQPSNHPTIQPSNLLIIQPSNHPTIQPSNHPTIQPSNHPTFQPANLPTFPTPNLLAKSSTCPTNVETLVSLLIKDLPSYANRVIQRSRRLSRADENYYVLVAGYPDFAPLTLGPGQYTPTPSGTDVEPPQQVFLTTLERQYQGGKAVNIQHYHWLFLVQTPDGWRLVMMFSRFGSASVGRPPTPPRESSNGVIGQAVNLWLRDCRAGAIRSSENTNT